MTVRKRSDQGKRNACRPGATVGALEQAMNAHAAVAILSTDGSVLSANDQFCAISKYDRDELVGMDFRRLEAEPPSGSPVSEMFERVADGGIWRGEIKCLAGDGAAYWVSATTSPVASEGDGSGVQYVCVQTDITAWKLAEEELRANSELMTSMFENFPGGISVFTRDLTLKAANRAFYPLLDIPEDRFPVGCSYEEIIRFNAEQGEYGDGDVEQLVAERVELAKMFKPHAFKRRRPGGRTLEVTGWPLPEGGFMSIHQDVSAIENMMTAFEEASNEAIRTAEELSKARDIQNQTHQHLVTSVNSMRNGFAIWDADDRLLLANDAYLQFHDPICERIVQGVTLQELLNAGCDAGVWDLQGCSRQDWLSRMTARRNGEGESEREVHLADGRQIVLEERVLDNGDVITTMIDVTAHRQREMELQDTKQQLERIAYFDGLTGLANRAHCQKDLVDKFAFTDPDSSFAIIQIDLDNFKRVNDTEGHACGDHLLQALGERLRIFSDHFSNFKAYRWGGDEFIALVERREDTDLDAMCEELTDLIAIPVRFDSVILRPTVSLGVARYPEDAPDLEALMIFADLALYKTKELGRDGYQFFTAEMKEKIDAESRIEQELRRAIETDQLELHFQPQISIKDGRITGLEALLRWNHPERGTISPSAFLEVVEDTGLAPAIGRQVFAIAMQTARQWIDDGVEFGRLAVNLSPQHLKQGSVLKDYFEAMNKFRIKPKFLAVEFLESFLFDDPHAGTAETLQRLRDRGIHVELDDFGTGYASLSHLSTMPINGLKIDQSFVRQMLEDPKRKGIVSSLISMAKLMDLDVVCEGVETEQQARVLAQIGHGSLQGYFIARPMNFADTTRWIEERRNDAVFTRLSEAMAAAG